MNGKTEELRFVTAIGVYLGNSVPLKWVSYGTIFDSKEPMWFVLLGKKR